MKNYVLFFALLSALWVCKAQNDSIYYNYFSIGNKTNGIAFGNPKIYNGLKFDLLSDGDKINGMQVSLFASHVTKINGISANLIYHGAEKINGFATSYLIDVRTLNGVFIGLGIGSKNLNTEGKQINGVAFGAAKIDAEYLNGLFIALGQSKSRRMNGISISLFNKTENLHGLQIGLINYAGNNPKGLKWLPFFNFHK